MLGKISASGIIMSKCSDSDDLVIQTATCVTMLEGHDH